MKKGSIFEYKDWYLDIFYDASSNKKPIILDKKELEEALRSNFLTQEEANIANKTARFLIEALKRKDFIDF